MKSLNLLVAGMTLMTAFNSWAISDADLQAKMRKDVEPYIVTLKKPKLFFHWVDASDVAPKGQIDAVLESRAQKFIDYSETQSKKVFNQRSEKDRDIAGPGFYLAQDPFYTRRYGGQKRFGLIVATIMTGTRLHAASYGQVFSKEVLNELAARQCDATDGVSLIDSTNKNCTKIKQLLLGQDLSFILGRLYNYGSNAPQMTGCNKYDVTSDVLALGSKQALSERQDTIVAYNLNLFSDLNGFTHKSTTNAKTPEANKILSFLKTASLDKMTGTQLISNEQMADKSIPVMSASEMSAFTKANILGCH
jgi:hypothetical protein